MSALEISLSADQKAAYEAVLDWAVSAKRGPSASRFSLGGVAGSGKSTLTGLLAKKLQDDGKLVAYVTFTGRASSILRGKLEDAGVEACNRMLARESADGRETFADKFPEYFLDYSEQKMAFCGTIHRLLYRPIIDSTTEEVTGYVKRELLDRPYDFIVLDEASMVGDRLLADLRFHGVPLLAVGDHAQLGPVGDEGSLMANPDVKLEKIHRVAEGNPIIALSRQIRETGRIQKNAALADPSGAIRFIPRFPISQLEALMSVFCEEGGALEAGMLCWQNKTRVGLNRMARKALGKVGPPRAGEPVICLKNYAQEGIYNGMRGLLRIDAVVDPSRQHQLEVDVDFPAERIGGIYTLCAYQIHRERTIGTLDEAKKFGPYKSLSELGLCFDFGYCATVHKWQGSQLQHAVVVVDWPQNGSEDTRRLSYTAVTRAVSKLTVVL